MHPRCVIIFAVFYLFLCDMENTINGRTCRLFGSERPACLLVQPSARHETATLEAEAAQIAALSPSPFALTAFEVEDWIVDLMPWSDGNISREAEAGRHGQETLQYVLLSLLPALRERYGDLPAVIGGYSLAGLFALWAACRDTGSGGGRCAWRPPWQNLLPRAGISLWRPAPALAKPSAT